MVIINAHRSVEYTYTNRNNMEYLDEAIKQKDTVVHCVLHVIAGQLNGYSVVEKLKNTERKELIGKIRQIGNDQDNKGSEEKRVRKRLLESEGNEDDSDKEKESIDKEKSNDDGNDASKKNENPNLEGYADDDDVKNVPEDQNKDRKEDKKKKETEDVTETVQPAPEVTMDDNTIKEAREYIRKYLREEVGITLVADCVNVVNGDIVVRNVETGYCNKDFTSFKFTQHFGDTMDSGQDFVTKTFQVDITDMEYEDEQTGYFIGKTYNSSLNKLRVFGKRCEIKVYSGLNAIRGISMIVLVAMFLNK